MRSLLLTKDPVQHSVVKRCQCVYSTWHKTL